MLETTRALRGMVVAPHHLAAEAGLSVLREGGNAIEAMLSAAATISVVYPHMNSIGGDNFWLISDGSQVLGIDACGAAAMAADVHFYLDRGLNHIPARGPLAANTVAGAISGWHTAMALSRDWGGSMPLERLFENAIYYARHGTPVTTSLHENVVQKLDELSPVTGFAKAYLAEGRPSPVGTLHTNSTLATTLEHLYRRGLEDFYRGELAQAIATELSDLGSPLTTEDLVRHTARLVVPLHICLENATVYNMPPPTQGLASLLVLGIFERLCCPELDGFEYIHCLVEATKRAFKIRDAHITDPAYMTTEPGAFLGDDRLDSEACRVDKRRAAPWLTAEAPGDTVWLGAIDNKGRAVSFIQSIYWEFGSGVVLKDTGISWQNRGTSFSLDKDSLNLLKPGRRPFHTIQPALANLKDGRLMVYGSMGGDGQPQTQATVFTRYVNYGQELQAAVTGPRWLLGRTWGDAKTSLRIEDRFDPQVIQALKDAGHDVEITTPFDDVMGHAGAIVRGADGILMGASDPRSDGTVAAY